MEFALIAPLMIAIYFGVAVLSGAVMAQKRTSRIASTIGDLAAGATILSPADLADIFAAGDALLSPADPAALQMRLSSVQENAQGVVTVAWSQQIRWTPLAVGGPYAGPATALLAPGQSIIIAEAHYQYSSPVQDLQLSWLPIPGTKPFDEVFYLAPSQVAAVTCPQCH